MRKETSQTIILLIALFPESVIETMLTPLNPYLVKHLVKDQSEVGHYVGLIGSAFFMPLFLMNTVWGAYSDKYGRRPVLIMGLYAFTLCILIYCLALNIWVCLAARFVAGIFGANSTITKGMLGELMTNEDDRSWAYAMYGVVFGVAGIVGPAFGGILVSNYKEVPLNQATDFWSTYPLVWPGIVGCLLGISGLYAVLFYLKETAGVNSFQKNQQPRDQLYTEDIPLSPIFNIKDEDDDSDVADRYCNDKKSSDSPIKRRYSSPLVDSQGLLESSYQNNVYPSPTSTDILRLENSRYMVHRIKTPIPYETMANILLYCFIAAANMMYFVATPLFFAASKSHGGLELSPGVSSTTMTILSSAKLIIQLLLFKPVMTFLGPSGTYQLGMLLILISNLMIYKVTTADFFLSFILVLMGTGEAFAYLSVIIMITSSASSPDSNSNTNTTRQRYPSSSNIEIIDNNSSNTPSELSKLGLVHGLASTAAAVVRTFFSSFSGYVWEWSTSSVPVAPFTVFVITSFIAGFGIVVCWVKKYYFLK